MNENIKKLLKQIGLNDTQISLFESETDLDLKPIVNSINSHHKLILENDPDFIIKFSSAEKGKIMEQIDRRLKQNFGLSVDELKEKTIEEKILLAKQTLETNLSKTGNELQQENINLKLKIKDLEETEIPRVRGEIDQFKRAFKIDQALSKLAKENRLKVSENMIMPALKLALENGYKIDIDENDNIQILTKDGLKVKNSEGTGIIEAKDIITSILKENKAIEESEPLKEEKHVVEFKQDSVSSSSMSEAERNLIEIKKRAGK